MHNLPTSEDCGIRDVDIVDHAAYCRVRATLPEDPKTPSVEDILEAMCVRLGNAYRYDYEAPKMGRVRVKRPKSPGQKRSSPTRERAIREILANPGKTRREIAVITGISRSYLDDIMAELNRQKTREEG
jgi:hypothetical protein